MKPNVLVMNNSANKTLIEHELPGYHFSFVESDSDVFTITKTRKYHAILADNQMTPLRGSDLARRLRRGRDTDIPVILFVENVQERFERSVLTCGAADVVLKNFEPVGLARIAAALRIVVHPRFQLPAMTHP